MSCYTNSRMKHNFLLQCSQSQCTSSEPPVSQMSSVGAVAFPASVELTFSPLLPVDSVGNSGDSRSINTKGRKFKELVFEMGFLSTVTFHVCSLILYLWAPMLKWLSNKWAKVYEQHPEEVESPLSTLYSGTKRNSLFLVCSWYCVLQSRSLPLLCQSNCSQV